MGRKIYVDMDGVLARWRCVPFEEVTKRDYFLNLEPEPSIVSAAILLLNAGADIEVLSSSLSVRACWEKRMWLDHVGLENIKSVFIPYGENKADYVNEDNALLIDDFGKNLSEWKGIPVKFYNGINGKNRTKYAYKLFKEWDAQTLVRNIVQFAEKGAVYGNNKKDQYQ